MKKRLQKPVPPRRGESQRGERGKQPNPLRIDPTRTLTLRKTFGRKLRGWYAILKARLWKLLVEQEVFGLGESNHSSSPLVSNRREWQFDTQSEQLRKFEAWLREQFRETITSDSAQELWERYIAEGFRKGAGRSFEDVKRATGTLPLTSPAGGAGLPDGGKEQFLRLALRSPVARERLEALVERTFTDLRGVEETLATRLQRSLADGLVAGKGPLEVARDLEDELEIGAERAETIARTELIRAHAEGQLEALEQLEVAEVGVEVEWRTAGDDRVCPLCEALEGEVFPIAEARGMLPRHPGCRCAWLPAGSVGEGGEFGRKGVGNMSSLETSRSVRAWVRNHRQRKAPGTTSLLPPSPTNNGHAGNGAGQLGSNGLGLLTWQQVTTRNQLRKERREEFSPELLDFSTQLHGVTQPPSPAKRRQEVSNESFFATCDRDDKGHCVAGVGGLGELTESKIAGRKLKEYRGRWSGKDGRQYEMTTSIVYTKTGEVSETVVTVTDQNGDQVAHVSFMPQEDALKAGWVEVNPNHRRNGLASEMYDRAAKATGRKLIKSDSQSQLGKAFTKALGLAGNELRWEPVGNDSFFATCKRDEKGHCTSDSGSNLNGALKRIKELKAKDDAVEGWLKTKDIFAGKVNPADAGLTDADLQQAQTTKRVEEIDLTSLVATQGGVKDWLVEAKLTTPDLRVEGESGGISVLRKNGKNYIIDGHHSAAAAILRGDTTAKARYYDADTPPNANLWEPLTNDNGSFFASCSRDEKGRCTAGENGGGAGGENNAERGFKQELSSIRAQQEQLEEKHEKQQSNLIKKHTRERHALLSRQVHENTPQDKAAEEVRKLREEHFRQENLLSTRQQQQMRSLERQEQTVETKLAAARSMHQDNAIWGSEVHGFQRPSSGNLTDSRLQQAEEQVAQDLGKEGSRAVIRSYDSRAGGSVRFWVAGEERASLRLDRKRGKLLLQRGNKREMEYKPTANELRWEPVGNESFFATCERDEKGRCTAGESKEGGGESESKGAARTSAIRQTEIIYRFQ